MLIDKLKSLENELKESKDHLKKFSSDKLEKMLFGQKHYSDKSGLGFDKFGASSSSSSHIASSSKPMFVKPMTVEEVEAIVVYFEKGKGVCLNDCVKPKSKTPSKKQTQGKLVPTCHYCGIVGHTRPNCFQLRSQKP